jgi:hypothetical protein
MSQAQVNNSRLELYNTGALQKMDLSEAVQLICNMNKEKKITEPNSNNSKREPIPEVASSSPKPDQSVGNKTEDVVVCRDAEGGRMERHWKIRKRGNWTISVKYKLHSIKTIRLKDMSV